MAKKQMGRPRVLEARFKQAMQESKVKATFETLMGIPFVTSEIIAEFFKTENDTLCRWVKREYNCTFADLKAQKHSNMKLKLAGKQFEVAMGGNIAMLIWLGKQYLGQSDKSETTSVVKLEDMIAEEPASLLRSSEDKTKKLEI